MFKGKEKHLDIWSLLAGIIFIAAAILVFVWPAKSFNAFIVIIGIVALCIGLYHMVLYKQLSKNFNESSYLVIFNGCLDIVIGLLFLFSGSFGFYIIAIIFAIWFVVDSGLDIKNSIQAQKHEHKKYFWVLITAGVIGVIIGIVLLFTPLLTDSLALIFIGIYFAIEGCKLMIRAF